MRLPVDPFSLFEPSRRQRKTLSRRRGTRSFRIRGELALEVSESVADVVMQQLGRLVHEELECKRIGLASTSMHAASISSSSRSKASTSPAATSARRRHKWASSTSAFSTSATFEPRRAKTAALGGPETGSRQSGGVYRPGPCPQRRTEGRAPRSAGCATCSASDCPPRSDPASRALSPGSARPSRCSSTRLAASSPSRACFSSSSSRRSSPRSPSASKDLATPAAPTPSSRWPSRGRTWARPSSCSSR